MSIINGVDYDNIARLAESTGRPFHKLCARAEKGLPLGNLAEQDNEWVDYRGAAKILCATYTSLAGTLSQNCEIDYFGIEWKSRSMTGAKIGKRGCGVLFKRADLVVVNNIRIGARLSLAAALKVYQAMELGRI